MKKEVLLAILIMIRSLLGTFIMKYFLQADNVSTLKGVPLWIILFCIAYILFQLLSYYISKEQNWWDWIYYVGMLTIMLTVSFTTENSFTFFNWLVKIGSCLLVIPPVIDLYHLTKKYRK